MLLPPSQANPRPKGLPASYRLCPLRLRVRGVRPRPSRRCRAGYLHAVLTFEALAAVMGHLVADEVGLPVEGLGALVTLVLPFLCVHNHVLLQAARGRGQESLGARLPHCLAAPRPPACLERSGSPGSGSGHLLSGQAGGTEGQRQPSHRTGGGSWALLQDHSSRQPEARQDPSSQCPAALQDALNLEADLGPWKRGTEAADIALSPGVGARRRKPKASPGPHTTYTPGRWAGGERVGLPLGPDEVGRAQLLGRGGCTWMKEQLLTPSSWGTSCSPSCPRCDR